MDNNLSAASPQAISPNAANYLNIEHSPTITSTELGLLWTSYMQYTMLRSQWKYFLAKTTTPVIRDLESETLGRIERRIDLITGFLKAEGFSIPVGFSDNDINLDAPSLYSESFFLHFLRTELKTSLTFNTLNLGLATRPDIRDFYSACVESSIRLNTKVTDLMLSEGILSKPPSIPVTDGTEFISEPSFLAGFIGEKRPLLAIELAHLYNNALSNDIGRTLLMGFKQVTSSKDVQNFMEKGIQLCNDFINTLSAKAIENQISLILTHDSGVTTSTIAPFSEKLMMFTVTALNAKAIGEYGVSTATAMRHDLAKIYVQMMIEAGQYSEQGAKIMMTKGWLEEPPHVPNREMMAKDKH